MSELPEDWRKRPRRSGPRKNLNELSRSGLYKRLKLERELENSQMKHTQNSFVSQSTISQTIESLQNHTQPNSYLSSWHLINRLTFTVSPRPSSE
jgi:hypothetical protein